MTNLYDFYCRSFITATFLGFAPGSFGIVYFGSAGKDILSSDGPNLPWYLYAALGGVVLYIAQYIGTLATNTLNSLEAEEKATTSKKP